MKEVIMAHDPKKGRAVKVGTYDSITKIFHKEVTAKHLFRKYESYAIQDSVVMNLEAKGCELVICHSPEGNFTSYFNEWTKLVPKDYGSGKQRFLPLKYMSRSF